MVCKLAASEQVKLYGPKGRNIGFGNLSMQLL